MEKIEGRWVHSCFNNQHQKLLISGMWERIPSCSTFFYQQPRLRHRKYTYSIRKTQCWESWLKPIYLSGLLIATNRSPVKLTSETKLSSGYIISSIAECSCSNNAIKLQTLHLVYAFSPRFMFYHISNHNGKNLSPT